MIKVKLVLPVRNIYWHRCSSLSWRWWNWLPFVCGTQTQGRLPDGGDILLKANSCSQHHSTGLVYPHSRRHEAPSQQTNCTCTVLLQSVTTPATLAGYLQSAATPHVFTLKADEPVHRQVHVSQSCTLPKIEVQKKRKKKREKERTLNSSSHKVIKI